MEYVMLEENFTGNDDVNVQGFIVREVESKKEWTKQIKANIKEELKDADGYLEIYNSDNCSTTFESVEEVMGIFTMKSVTKEQFQVLCQVFGHSNNVVEYGQVEDFFDYVPPAPKNTESKEKAPVLHGKIVEETKLYFQDATSDKVYYITLEEVKNGFVVNYENGKRLDKDGNPGKLTQGTKTDKPVNYEEAKEIFDALVKFKKDYTTAPPNDQKTKKNKLK